MNSLRSAMPTEEIAHEGDSSAGIEGKGRRGGVSQTGKTTPVVGRLERAPRVPVHCAGERAEHFGCHLGLVPRGHSIWPHKFCPLRTGHERPGLLVGEPPSVVGRIPHGQRQLWHGLHLHNVERHIRGLGLLRDKRKCTTISSAGNGPHHIRRRGKNGLEQRANGSLARSAHEVVVRADDQVEVSKGPALQVRRAPASSRPRQAGKDFRAVE
mmetsp:Transcript_113140/g.352674  ORF Transcript_113140/g.352674 Transcript_113140/m.352674 type:complete len:212 (+) Transcript_113140:394-1029(+)